MKDLSSEARALLDSARHADAAPLAVRQRARQNFVHAIAAGTVSASAAVAKAASIAAVKSAAHAGASVATSSSLTATVVSAVVTGVSLGMIALSPASKAIDVAAPVAAAQVPMPSASVPHPRDQHSGQTTQSAEPQPVDTPAPAAPSQAAPPTAHFQNLPDDAVRERNVTAKPSVPMELAAASVAPGSTAVFDPITAAPPSRVSIARETELLAQVQRALQQGQAASALTLLKRYAAEFPHGMLEEEAIASRVVALCLFGRIDDAAHWRAEFFVRYPNSPLGGRVRNACPTSLGVGSNQPGAK